MRDGVEFHVEEYRGAGFRTVSVVAELGGFGSRSSPTSPWRRSSTSRCPGKDVSELGEVLELIHTSEERWRSLRAWGREWRHSALHLEAFMREAARRRSGSVAVFGESSLEPEEPVESEELWRLWMARPDKVRAEFAVGHGETVTAVWGPRDGTRQVRRAHVSALGVSAEKTVITYDDFNTTFAARFWRVLNYYSHTQTRRCSTAAGTAGSPNHAQSPAMRPSLSLRGSPPGRMRR